MCGSGRVVMRTLPMLCARYIAGMSASASMRPHSLLARIISSDTSLSIGEPRLRTLMITLPSTTLKL
ncbi:hypothetical protein D3C72_2412850 [compost metagenome]